jgi:hypothetical protein
MKAPLTGEPAPQAHRQLPAGAPEPYPDAFVEQLTKPAVDDIEETRAG